MSYIKARNPPNPLTPKLYCSSQHKHGVREISGEKKTIAARAFLNRQYIFFEYVPEI